jgi:26S proteasome regulatory subunit T5
MQIHSRKMNTNKDVNFEELARCTDDFNGAQCKAVCIEAVRIISFFENLTFFSS